MGGGGGGGGGGEVKGEGEGEAEVEGKWNYRVARGREHEVVPHPASDGRMDAHAHGRVGPS